MIDSEHIIEVTPEHREPFWGYGDLALFLGAVLPSFLLAAVLVRVLRLVAPGHIVGETWRTLLFQGFAYAFLVGALYLVVAWRHREPFFRSMGWRVPVPRAFLLVIAGLILALGVASAGVFLPLPPEASQLEDLFTGRRALVAWMIWGIFIAPPFEELVFRGFLFPVFARSTGPWLGIVFTAILFGLLHGAQNHWAWQPVLLISLAGVVFGIVRYKTGSTAASSVLHAAYNATQFGLIAVTRWAALK